MGGIRSSFWNWKGVGLKCCEDAGAFGICQSMNKQKEYTHLGREELRPTDFSRGRLIVEDFSSSPRERRNTDGRGRRERGMGSFGWADGDLSVERVRVKRCGEGSDRVIARAVERIPG